MYGVVPAQQRFEARDLAGLDGDDRLVLEPQLVTVEGQTELSLELHSIDGLAGKVRREDGRTRGPRALRLIGSQARRVEQLSAVGYTPRRGRDADAGRRQDSVTLRGDGAEQRSLDVEGEKPGRLGLGHGQQIRELSGPRSPEQTFGRRQSPKASRKPLESTSLGRRSEA